MNPEIQAALERLNDENVRANVEVWCDDFVEKELDIKRELAALIRAVDSTLDKSLGSISSRKELTESLLALCRAITAPESGA